MSSIKFGTYTPRQKEDMMQGNEVSKPIKEHQFFYCCYVTDMDLHDGKYAVTVVAWYDLKRYMQSLSPQDQKHIYQVVDIVAVGLDGNGMPRVGWHEKQLIKEVPTKHYKDGERMDVRDAILGTGITMEYEDISSIPAGETLEDQSIVASKQKASHRDMADNLFNHHKLSFGPLQEINLTEDFITAIKAISKFTRENDVTFPYAVMNKEMQEFDNIRTAVGLVSSILPIGKAFVMTKQLINAISVGVGGSPLVAPASDLYDLRGPVKLSKVKYKTYHINDRGYYQHDGMSKDYSERDEILIMY